MINLKVSKYQELSFAGRIQQKGYLYLQGRNMSKKLFIVASISIFVLFVSKSQAAGWCKEGFVNVVFSEMTKFNISTMKGTVHCTLMLPHKWINLNKSQVWNLDKYGFCIAPGVGQSIAISCNAYDEKVHYIDAPIRYKDVETYAISVGNTTKNVTIKRKDSIQPPSKKVVDKQEDKVDYSFDFEDAELGYMYVMETPYNYKGGTFLTEKEYLQYLTKKAIPISAESIGITPMGPNISGNCDCCVIL
jgi:hypothetical protein